jgi:hypothetical protein
MRLRLGPRTVVIFILVLIVQCGSPEPTCTPGPTRLPEPTSVLLTPLLKARSIRILKLQEFGISTTPRVDEMYDLHRTGGSFQGDAAFFVRGAHMNEPLHGSTLLTIPLGVVQDFLRALAQVALAEGEHETPLFCTDCPRFSLRIDLELETGDVAFFLESPNVFAGTPWLASLGEQEYLVHSDAPLRALERLEPFLGGGVLETLLEEASAP